MIGCILTSIFVNLPSGWAHDTQVERNISDSWELSLCIGCTPCHFDQRMCPETALVSYCRLISHPGIPFYPKLEVNRIWSDLRVYWEQGELGCDDLPPFSSPRCVFLTSNLFSTQSPQQPSTYDMGNPRLLSFAYILEQLSQPRGLFLM